MTYTPSGINVSVGLLQNKGFDLSKISSIANAYNATTLAAKFKAVIAASNAMGPISKQYNTPFILTIGANYLPGLLGTMPSGSVAVLGSSYTFPDRAYSQAATIFPGNPSDISSLIQNVFKAIGATSLTGDFFRTAHDLYSKSFSQFNATNFSDTTTGGVGAFLKVRNTNIAACGTELKRLGYIVTFPDPCTETDTLDLSGPLREASLEDSSVNTSLTPVQGGGYVECQTTTEDLFNPVTFLQNLLEKGADGIVPNLASQINAILPYSTPSDLAQYADSKFAQQKATALLKSINDAPTLSNVQDLLTTDLTTRSGADPKTTVKTLNDFLDPRITLPGLLNYIDYSQLGPLADFFMKPSFSQTIKNFHDAGTMMETMSDAPSIPTLDSKTHIVTDSDLSIIKSVIPIFDDDNIGPTPVDLIGVVAGLVVGDAISNATPQVTRAASTTEGIAILALLDSMIQDFADLAGYDADYTTSPFTNPSPPPFGSGLTLTDYKNQIEAQMTLLMNNSNAYIQEIVAATGTNFASGATHLAHQVTSLARMNIDLTQVTAHDLTTLMSFGRSIGDIAKDPSLNALFTNLVTGDQYGQAILAAITEKKNSDEMSAAGLTIPNNLIPPSIGNVSPSSFT